MRWPHEFVCPVCGDTKGHRLTHLQLMQCAGCHAQAATTAGTIFHATKLPLTTWFRALHHLTQSKNGISAMELMRRLDVSYNTAWLMKHNLIQVMKERELTKRLEQRIETDDAYIGGERPATAGRGAQGKTPFIAAVETDFNSKPLRIAMQAATGFTRAAISAFAKAKLAPSREVISDGLACFSGVVDQGCSHTYVVSVGGRKSAENPSFKWVNTSLGNIKSALSGTYRHIAPKHVPRYLAEFQYRFNRRDDLGGMFTRLAWVSVRTPPCCFGS